MADFYVDIFIFYHSLYIKMAATQKTLAKLAKANNIAEVEQRLAQGANIDEKDESDVRMI